MMKSRVAMISGARGQFASHMADLLLQKGYDVVAFERRSGSARDYSNIKHLLNNPKYHLECADLCDFSSLSFLVQKYKPDKIFHFAAQSMVKYSFEQPLATLQINHIGTTNLLESVRLYSPSTKFYFQSSSEVYGGIYHQAQNEGTATHPRSPYAASKIASESLISVYRDAYDIWACYCRIFNTEGTRRGEDFVTRKITSWIGNLVSTCESRYGIIDSQKMIGLVNDRIIQKLKLGNIESFRDWSDCRDMVKGIYLVVDQDRPDDYVLGSGKTYTITEFLKIAFAKIGIDNFMDLIEIDPDLYRPAEVNYLCSDPLKMYDNLGWKTTISLNDMISDMIDNDIHLHSSQNANSRS